MGLYTVDQFAVLQLGLHVSEGVLITEVVANSPAAQAGLQQYDVVVNIGGIEVKTVAEFMRVLHSSTIGQPLEMIFWRGDIEYTTTVIPIESPKP